MRGAPPGSKLIASWLVWGVITRKPNEQLYKQASFNGTMWNGEILGETEEPCWDTTGLQGARFVAYWAPVTTALAGQINGSFAVELFGGAVTDGRTPWSGPVGQPPDLDSSNLHNGATLISVYSHPSVPVEAKVVLHKSTDLIIDRATYNMDLPALPSATRIRHLRVGGDGQTRSRDTPLSIFRTEVRFDGGPWVLVAGPGSPINQHSDWQGTDGGPIDQLWDTHLTDAPVTLFNLQPGLQTYEVRYEPDLTSGLPFDCVAMVLHGLSVY